MGSLKQEISTSRLVDSVCDRLRERIFSGDIAPGTKLRIQQLATEMSVSRSPIREAVLRLTRDGLAVELPRRGAVVALITQADLVRIFEVREVLEGLAARLATLRAPKSLVKELREIVTAHERAAAKKDFAAGAYANVCFHRAIRNATGNSELINALDSIEAKVRLSMQSVRATFGQLRAIEEHAAIITAIEGGSPDEAERIARKHVAAVREHLIKAVADSDLQKIQSSISEKSNLGSPESYSTSSPIHRRRKSVTTHSR